MHGELLTINAIFKFLEIHRTLSVPLLYQFIELNGANNYNETMKCFFGG